MDIDSADAFRTSMFEVVSKQRACTTCTGRIDAIAMYDTHAGTITLFGSANGTAGDAFAPRDRERLAVVYDGEHPIEIVPLESEGDDLVALGVAVRTQMRDNLALGET